MATYSGEPLNVLHTIGLDTLYPIIRCKIEFANRLDQAKFINALTAVTKIVPEVLCKYKLATNSFESVTQEAADVIRVNLDDPDADAMSFDLMNEPQLRIYWNTFAGKDRLTFYMSHILTDGAGFKQFIYLLAQAYSDGPQSIAQITNQSDIEWLMKLVKKAHRTAQHGTDHPDAALELPKLAKVGPDYRAVGSIKLDQKLVAALSKKAHTDGVTLNDVFMSAFGRAIQRYDDVPRISLACPTDMRQFEQSKSKTIRQIANLTSRYNLSIPASLDESFNVLVQRVHRNMTANKNEQQCFDSITDLLTNYQKYPLTKLQQIVEENYHVREIAYTNFGIVNSQRLVFSGSLVENITLTGSFRKAPMFQVAVATYNDATTLAFNMIGTKNEYNFGLAVTRSMADMLKLYVQC